MNGPILVILFVFGAAIVMLNIWYVRKYMESRRSAMQIDLDGDPFIKPSERDNSRLQFWIMTIGNAVGLLIAFLIIMSFVTGDVTVAARHYEAQQNGTAPAPAAPAQ